MFPFTHGYVLLVIFSLDKYSHPVSLVNGCLLIFDLVSLMHAFHGVIFHQAMNPWIVRPCNLFVNVFFTCHVYSDKLTSSFYGISTWISLIFSIVCSHLLAQIKFQSCFTFISISTAFYWLRSIYLFSELSTVCRVRGLEKRPLSWKSVIYYF